MVMGARWATFVSSFCAAPPRAGAWLANAPPPWFVGVQGTSPEASGVLRAEMRGSSGTSFLGSSVQVGIGILYRHQSPLKQLLSLRVISLYDTGSGNGAVDSPRDVPPR